MVVATPYNYGDIATDFNYAEQFKLYKIKDGSIVTTDLVLTNGSGYFPLISLLSRLNVNVLVCGTLKAAAKKMLDEFNIKYVCGNSGDSDKAVEHSRFKRHLVRYMWRLNAVFAVVTMLNSRTFLASHRTCLQKIHMP